MSLPIDRSTLSRTASLTCWRLRRARSRRTFLVARSAPSSADIPELAVRAVNEGYLGLRRDYAFEAGDVLSGHQRFSIGTGFFPGSGPTHCEAGRMMRRSASDSSTCDVQPAMRDMANTHVKSSFGMPAPVSTTDAQKSTLVALGRSGCASWRILSATSSVCAASWCSFGSAVFAISRRILARGSYVL